MRSRFACNASLTYSNGRNSLESERGRGLRPKNKTYRDFSLLEYIYILILKIAYVRYWS